MEPLESFNTLIWFLETELFINKIVWTKNKYEIQKYFFKYDGIHNKLNHLYNLIQLNLLEFILICLIIMKIRE